MRQLRAGGVVAGAWLDLFFVVLWLWGSLFCGCGCCCCELLVNACLTFCSTVEAVLAGGWATVTVFEGSARRSRAAGKVDAGGICGTWGFGGGALACPPVLLLAVGSGAEAAGIVWTGRVAIGTFNLLAAEAPHFFPQKSYGGYLGFVKQFCFVAHWNFEIVKWESMKQHWRCRG